MITIHRICKECGRKFTFTWPRAVNVSMPELCRTCNVVD